MSSRRVKIPEPFRPAYKAAKKAKWTVARTEACHLVWTSPAGDRVITPSTPHGGHRSVLNSLAQLRRAGLHC